LNRRTAVLGVDPALRVKAGAIALSIFLLLHHASPARAEFTLSVTEAGRGSRDDGPAYPAACSKIACRATLPIHVGVDACILNVWLGAPTRNGMGGIRFVAGPCRSGRQVSIPDGVATTAYRLDRFGATSSTHELQFLIHEASGDFVNSVEVGAVRLDVICTEAPPNAAAR
jgi:hypothetical protein